MTVYYERHPAARYEGSLPEYHGRIGCLVPAASGDPQRSDMILWDNRQFPFCEDQGPAILRGVRRGSVDVGVTIDMRMPCPCGLLGEESPRAV